MTGTILYCGDTELNGAASYLAGLLESWGYPYEYKPSHIPVEAHDFKQQRAVIIVSDYPAQQFSAECQKLAIQQIEQGCGLLMIGGWESFHGLGGDWDTTVLGSILPVEIQSTDDRVNFEQSAWLLPDEDHEITAGLPWNSCPPAIGGMNRVQEKPSSQVVLRAHSFSIAAQTAPRLDSIVWSMEGKESLPALVVNQHGAGRTAAFLSDIAPHWVGGFVDWGLPRVTARAKNAPAVEVGGDYARFWKQLINWLGRGPA